MVRTHTPNMEQAGWNARAWDAHGHGHGHGHAMCCLGATHGCDAGCATRHVMLCDVACTHDVMSSPVM